jgi:hypothetical protein
MEKLNNPIYKEVLPCGYLRVQDRSFLLMNPYPLPPESWQLPEQQRFLVVPNLPDLAEYNGHRVYQYDYARDIVCTHPLIQYNVMSPVMVMIGYDDGNGKYVDLTERGEVIEDENEGIDIWGFTEGA